MQELTTGAGLAALGFWLFIGITVAVGVWGSIRRRDAQHETLRRVIESGQPIDENLTDKLLALSGESKDMERDLKVTAILFYSLAPGMVALGWGLSVATEPILLPIMLGVAALLGLLGIGFHASACVSGPAMAKVSSLTARFSPSLCKFGKTTTPC